MTIAAYKDVVRVFPGLQDHTVAEILEMKATVNELEAALVMLSGDEEQLIDIQTREGDQIHRILSILSRSEVQAREDRDI